MSGAAGVIFVIFSSKEAVKYRPNEEQKPLYHCFFMGSNLVVKRKYFVLYCSFSSEEEVKESEK